MAATSQSLRIKILGFGYSAGLTLIRWDSKDEALKLSTTKYRSSWKFIQNVLILLYQLFLIYQSTIRDFGSGFSQSDLVRVRYTTALWLFLNVNHVGDAWASEYVGLMNGLESLKMKCGVNVGEGRAAVFNKVFAFITSFSTVAITISALVGSTSLTLLNSLFLPDGGGTPVGVPLRAVAAAFHFVTNASRRFDLWMKCNSVVYFAFGMFNILERMASFVGHTSSDRPSLSNFRGAMQFSKGYRALAVLQAHYTALFSHYIALIQAGSIFAVTFTAYQAVKGGSLTSLLLALAVIFGHVQFIEANAQVYDTSSDALNKWRHVGRGDVPLWFPRFLKSCRKVYVPVGSFFYIDRGLVLTVLSAITNASASLILAK